MTESPTTTETVQTKLTRARKVHGHLRQARESLEALHGEIADNYRQLKQVGAETADLGALRTAANQTMRAIDHAKLTIDASQHAIEALERVSAEHRR